jgi:hypothetical protein
MSIETDVRILSLREMAEIIGLPLKTAQNRFYTQRDRLPPNFYYPGERRHPRWRYDTVVAWLHQISEPGSPAALIRASSPASSPRGDEPYRETTPSTGDAEP